MSEWHSRHDERHYMTCSSCYDDHLDFMLDQEVDDFTEEQDEEQNE